MHSLPIDFNTTIGQSLQKQKFSIYSGAGKEHYPEKNKTVYRTGEI
jgi:hypothetical protein